MGLQPSLTLCPPPTSSCRLAPSVFLVLVCPIMKSTFSIWFYLFYLNLNVFYPFPGPSVYSFVHKPDLVHDCKCDILLCRRKADCPSEWTRVRRLPSWTSFSGPFILCKGRRTSENIIIVFRQC